MNEVKNLFHKVLLSQILLKLYRYCRYTEVDVYKAGGGEGTAGGGGGALGLHPAVVRGAVVGAAHVHK
jgi:hypothetical protein